MLRSLREKKTSMSRQIIYTSQEKEEGGGRGRRGGRGGLLLILALHMNQLFNMMFHSQQLNDKNDK